jgi:hypothetical protein
MKSQITQFYNFISYFPLGQFSLVLTPIHSHNSEIQAITELPLICTLYVPRYKRIRVLSLHQSYPGNGFITVSLSLQITHKVFFSPPNSFPCHFFSVTSDCHLQNSTQFLTTFSTDIPMARTTQKTEPLYC